jgi:hypothetical protein
VIEQMPLLGRTLGPEVFDARLTALVLVRCFHLAESVCFFWL